MKKKNILYHILNFILIIFTVSFIVPMCQHIMAYEDTLYSVYKSFSLEMITIFSILLFVINLVIGIANIKKKNIAIGVLTIVSGAMALFIIALMMLYAIAEDDLYGYMMFGLLFCQILLSTVSLILNRKKETSPLKKHSIILFCIIVLIGAITVTLPRILLEKNKNNIRKAYAILKEQPTPQLFIDRNSNFYDVTGNLIMENPYQYIKVNKVDNSGTYILTARDNNGKLWIIDYTGEKLVRMYDTFMDYFTVLLPDVHFDDDRTESSDTLHYLTLQQLEGNYLKFTKDDNEITIEVEIDTTQLESDTSFSKLLEKSYIKRYDYPVSQMKVEGIDLETIYQYKKDYYLTYQNKERVKLDCHNLLIDYDEDLGNFVLFLYNNWNIPFYDEQESGFYDLAGNKHSIDKQYLVYDTLDNYCILYDTSGDSFYLSDDTFKDKEELEDLRDTYWNRVVYTKDYILYFKDSSYDPVIHHLYTIHDGTLEELPNIRSTINILLGDTLFLSPKVKSVYDIYIVPSIFFE